MKLLLSLVSMEAGSSAGDASHMITAGLPSTRTHENEDVTCGDFDISATVLTNDARSFW